MLISDVKVSKPNITTPTLSTKAIWDTGATNSVITKAAAEKLGLAATGMVRVKGVNQTNRTKAYLVDIHLPNRVVIKALKVTECSDLTNSSIEMLIGMDVIGIGDFAVSCYQGITSFSFRFPSVAHADYIVPANGSDKKGPRFTPSKKDKRKKRGK